jgi:hypothetical protein
MRAMPHNDAHRAQPRARHNGSRRERFLARRFSARFLELRCVASDLQALAAAPRISAQGYL